jgi:hypothetical protein
MCPCCDAPIYGGFCFECGWFSEQANDIHLIFVEQFIDTMYVSFAPFLNLSVSLN